MEKTTVYLSSDLHKALKEAARSQKKAQAEVLRTALEEYLARTIHKTVTDHSARTYHGL